MEEEIAKSKSICNIGCMGKLDRNWFFWYNELES